ncbi:MAG: class I SAM-dependent methyltransferase [Solirubrobacteraceae bacterium]
MSASDRGRLAETYGSYRGSPGKQRAWSVENPGNMAIRRELAEAVFQVAGEQLRSARRVLDAGCGGGWWLSYLSGDPSIRAQLHGVDLLDERVEAARQRVPDAQVLRGDLRKLPYEDKSMDAVFLFTALSSLFSREDCLLALFEAKRVLGPGGLVVVWEPRVPNPLNSNTLLVRRTLLRRAFGTELRVRSLTLAPPLARRLGRRTETLYPALARLPALRTHRIAWCERARG